MILSRKYAAVLLAALAGATVAALHSRAQPQGQTSYPTQAQTPTASQMDRNVVALDPAHGGQDGGATLGGKILEKDVTLSVAARLRAALTAAGFTVVSTREADSVTTPLTNDQRAEIVNRAHPLACIVIHATASGSGVHIYTSALQPPEEDTDLPSTSPPAFVPVPWEMAQVGFASQSLRLASDLSAALGKADLPVIVGREPVRPLDNLECPAVAIELAPLSVAGSDSTPVTDADYQQRVAGVLTTTLQAWRDYLGPSAPNAAATGGALATGPALQAQAAAPAARAAAEVAGRAAVGRAVAKTAADRPHADLGSQAGVKGRTNDDTANSADKASQSNSSNGAGDQPGQTEGTQ